MGKRKRRYPGVPNLLIREETKEHRVLIECLQKQANRKQTTNEKKLELRKQIRNLRAELWAHKQTRKAKPRKAEEKTYKGAEY